jgi:hypothetical protein
MWELIKERSCRTGKASRRLWSLTECFAVAFLALSVEPSSARGQRDSAGPALYRARVLGVFDGMTGGPIEGAQVIDVLSRWSALTTRTGTVALVFLPEGRSVLSIRKLGYEAQTIAISISPKDTVPITINLSPAVQLDPVVTSSPMVVRRSPALRAFDERQRAGMGHFVSDSALRKSEGKRLSDLLLTRIPGLSLRTGRDGTYLRSMRIGGLKDFCEPTVFLDGVRATDANLDVYNTSDLGGVEFYSGEATVPVEFASVGTSSGCGLLLLWTRDR